MTAITDIKNIDSAVLHPDLYLAFTTIAETSSFTLAAERLGLRQSTISQQIKRLEEAFERPLFARDTHAVTLTSDGEALLDYARDILALNRRVERHFSDIGIRGRLRVGISEDFAASRLPQVLRDFVADHRGVDLELTVDISGPLYQRLDDGGLDVVLAKRLRGERRGALAWAEDLVWAARPDIGIDAAAPVPLVVFGAPSVTRARAIAVLEKARRSWLVACTSGSLFGLQAAALAGLGVMPFARSLLPEGLVPLSARAGLPPLGRVEFVVVAARRHDPAARALVDRLIAGAEQLRRPRGS